MMQSWLHRRPLEARKKPDVTESEYVFSYAYCILKIRFGDKFLHLEF